MNRREIRKCYYTADLKTKTVEDRKKEALELYKKFLKQQRFSKVFHQQGYPKVEVDPRGVPIYVSDRFEFL